MENSLLTIFGEIPGTGLWPTFGVSTFICIITVTSAYMYHCYLMLCVSL